ncbi:putative hydrolase of the HAD superfamily [Chitinophaga skermanii]|uniref:Putative hydrolase of the HAD superfamily n=1 Tax=Chitinophaga skermanii TaxID=331697 RepID=A0A327QSL7_9BACT|nr:HAD family hydrolase [Chitinophaga skermanii]RAJ06895.1 putative hydrolase of the HAD superfamily [Chitinophaga skermanii]
MTKDIKVIAFDADDTLWDNEIYFREAEQAFKDLIQPYTSATNIVDTLFNTELQNLPIYGYGIKGFTLSMVETAVKLTQGDLPPHITHQILDIGKSMLNRPVQLIDGVESVLDALHKDYRLMVATKGDLLDQQRKVKQSQLMQYFKHVEVMSDKKENDYRQILQQQNIAPKEFLMIGNSLKSDVLPVLNIDAHAVHVPYAITWLHEHAEVPQHPNFLAVEKITEILNVMR